jgi:hypothetical protein
MKESTESKFYSRSTRPSFRFLEIEICHDIGLISYTTTRDANERSETIFQSDRDKKLARGRDLYRQRQIEKHEKRKEQSISNPEYSTSLNIKECVLDVQAIYLRQLAVEENHVK